MAEMNADLIEQSFREVLGEAVQCFPEGDLLVLDTPYILQDGHFLRAYLESTDSGLVASDGGFVQRQLETFCRTPAMLRERTLEVKAIANELSLLWDGELTFVERDLRTLLSRLSVLARATDRSLSVLGGRPPRKRVDVRSRLRDQLIEFGLAVKLRARPEVPNGMKPVVVDQLVRRNGRQAAVEVITAKTDGGAYIAVDRAITNFHVLDRYDYTGSLIAVYDHQSPAASKPLLDRLEAAKPDAAIVIPDQDAARAIQKRLAG